MTLYIAACQCVLWITTFDHSGLEIARRVRDGSIASELLRPVGFAWLQLSQILGLKAYNFVFRSLVLALIFRLTVGFGPPAGWTAGLLSAAAWVLAAYTGALMVYFVGLAGFWTTEPSWMYLLLQSLAIFLGGASIPLTLLPGALAPVALASPFACMAYYPAAIYLGWMGARGLIPMVFWPAALTALALRLTAAARRRLEVVGG
jgi:ABC-2 type transport system permease protein